MKLHPFILVCLFLTGCMPNVLFVNKNFKDEDLIAKYDTLSGGVSRLINTDGYFSNEKTRGIMFSGIQQNYEEKSTILFYDNGCCGWFCWKESNPIFMGKDNIDLSAHILRSHFPRSLNILANWLRNDYDTSGGLYVIKGDTIITEHLEIDYKSYVDIQRFAFKVIDREHIRLIYNDYYTHDWVSHQDYTISDKSFRDFYFHRAYNIPPPLNQYDKHRKYRWLSEVKWAEYDTQRKRYLKSLKSKK